MSKHTLDFHYGKHHKGYVEKANKLIRGTIYENMSMEEIVLKSYGNHQKIFNNTAQAWNHSFFWKCLTPMEKAPSDSFRRLLEKQFGSLREFQDQFTKISIELFGSGWAWLVKTSPDSLAIIATHNAENPLIKDQTPLMTCDIWEHAYYLDYQNERSKYLKHFWALTNWDFVEENFEREPLRKREALLLSEGTVHLRH